MHFSGFVEYMPGNDLRQIEAWFRQQQALRERNLV